MDKKIYSIMFRNQDMPTLIEMDQIQFDALMTGKFVNATKYNTKTHSRTFFAFSLEIVQAIQESDYQIEN